MYSSSSSIVSFRVSGTFLFLLNCFRSCFVWTVCWSWISRSCFWKWEKSNCCYSFRSFSVEGAISICFEFPFCGTEVSSDCNLVLVWLNLQFVSNELLSYRFLFAALRLCSQQLVRICKFCLETIKMKTLLF